MIYNLVYWVQIVSLVYVLTSAPIYIFVIGTVVHCRKEPHFKNSFFLVWVSLGFSDLTHSIIYWFSAKLPLMGFFPSFFLGIGEGFAGIMMTLSFVTHFAQVLGIVLMSINRLTALVFPTKSEPFWTRKWVVPSCVAAVWTVSCVLSVPVSFMRQNWIQETNQSKVAFHFLSHSLAAPYMLVVGILLASVTIATIGVYIFMFYKVQKMSVEQKKALKTQLKLALCGFLVAAFLTLLSVCFCLFSFYNVTISFGDNAALFFVSCDLNTFCNVYLLLATSKVVRRRVFMMARKIFCCREVAVPLTKSNARLFHVVHGRGQSSRRVNVSLVGLHSNRRTPYGSVTNSRMPTTKI